MPDMEANTGHMHADIAATPRARIRVDGRTRTSRAAKRWVGILSAACGNTTNELTREQIKRAAQLVALAEEARIAALSDPSADAVRHLQRAERMATAATVALGYFKF
jgi:hypothetical protein